MARQTELTLDQIIAAIGEAPSCDTCHGKHSLPKGVLANELGEIAFAGGQEASKAEAELCNLLANGSARCEQYIAYYWLRDLQRLGRVNLVTAAALIVFESNGANSEIVEYAKAVSN